MVGETPARLALALHLVGVEGEKPEEPTMSDHIRAGAAPPDVASSESEGV